MIRQFWQTNFLRRFFRSAAYLPRKVKISPSALFLGDLTRISVGPRSSVGARTKLRATREGIINLRRGVWISSDVEIDASGTIAVGEGTTIQRRCTINGTVKLGRECILAPNVFISSGTHPFRADPSLSIREQERRIAAGLLEFADMDRPVEIGDDCWLGTNVVVCPGVHIGDHCVVGANSVVTKDLPAYGVYAGIPARKIGSRSEG